MSKNLHKIKTLVIPDRIHTRIQPEVYFAFESAAKECQADFSSNKVQLIYSLFNPFMAKFQYPSPLYNRQIEFMKLLNNELSKTIIEIKKNSSPKLPFWYSIQKFMRENSKSCINNMYNELEKELTKYSFIIIESTARTAIHPFYYDNTLTDRNYDYACEYDLIDTLLGLFYIDIASKHNILTFATCHGSQLAYIHAGGKLKRLANPYYFVPENYYYPIKNPHDESIIEIWQFDEDLMNARNIRDGSRYTEIKTPLPQIFKINPKDKSEKYINRDFNQTLAMVGPTPKSLNILLYHPLSLYKPVLNEYEQRAPIPKYPEVTKDKIVKFKNFLRSEVIVDTFIYKNIYAFQHHPQYTYNYGSNSEIFKFLIKNLNK